MPADRRRRYSGGVWNPYIVFSADLDVNTFKERFYQPLTTDASIFLNADPSRGAVQEQSFYPKELEDLSSVESCKCEDYLVRAKARGLCSAEDQWTIAFALVDLTQNASFRSIATVKFPALLRRTRLWDLVTDKPIGEVPLWLCQGFPHPAALGLPEELKEEFPFPDIMPSCSGPSSTKPEEPAGKHIITMLIHVYQNLRI